MRLLILACVSGALSYLSVSLPHLLASHFALSDDVLFFLPGVLFGLFVLVPLVKDINYRALRRFGLLILSVGAWYAAVSTGIQVLPLVKQTPIASCGISGSVGVLLLALGSRYLVPWKFEPSSIFIAAFVGFLGGAIIGMALRQPRASLSSEFFYLLGFLFWHCSVAWSLFGKPSMETTKKSKTNQAV